MINRTCEILNVLNGIKSEIGQSVSVRSYFVLHDLIIIHLAIHNSYEKNKNDVQNDQDTINLIRTKRTTVGPSATRTKYRKRSVRVSLYIYIFIFIDLFILLFLFSFFFNFFFY
jgi:hypothetical protein